MANPHIELARYRGFQLQPNPRQLRIGEFSSTNWSEIGGVGREMEQEVALFSGRGHLTAVHSGSAEIPHVAPTGTTFVELSYMRTDNDRIRALRDEEGSNYIFTPRGKAYGEEIADDLLRHRLPQLDVVVRQNPGLVRNPSYMYGWGRVFQELDPRDAPVVVERHHDHSLTPGDERAADRAAYGHLIGELPYSVLVQSQPYMLQTAISKEKQQELSAIFRIPQSDILLVPNSYDPYWQRFSSDSHLESYFRKKGLFDHNDFNPNVPGNRSFIDALPPRIRTFVTQRLTGLSESQIVMKNKQPVIGVLPARFTTRKRIMEHIEVVKALREAGINMKLVITGGLGVDSKDKNQKIYDDAVARRDEYGLQDSVIIMYEDFRDETGKAWLSDQRVNLILAGADMLMFLTEGEGQGIPIDEAIANRLLIASSQNPNMKLDAPDIKPVDITKSYQEQASQIKRKVQKDANLQREMRLRATKLPEATYGPMIAIFEAEALRAV